MLRAPSGPQRHLGMGTPAALLILLGIVVTRTYLSEVSAESVTSPTDAGSRTVASGVYTEPQRQQGMLVYLKRCSGCHGERLRGGESAPALTGPDFRQRWYDHTLGDLMQKILLMPPKDPGELTPREAASVIAVVLAVNGFPAGKEEVPADLNLLQQIKIGSGP